MEDYTQSLMLADCNWQSKSDVGRLMLAEIQDDVLEASVCKPLSLTGVTFAPEDLHACHRMKRLERVIIKFKCRKQKQSAMYKRKNLGAKYQ